MKYEKRVSPRKREESSRSYNLSWAKSAAKSGTKNVNALHRAARLRNPLPSQSLSEK